MGKKGRGKKRGKEGKGTLIVFLLMNKGYLW